MDQDGIGLLIGGIITAALFLFLINAMGNIPEKDVVATRAAIAIWLNEHGLMPSP